MIKTLGDNIQQHNPNLMIKHFVFPSKYVVIQMRLLGELQTFFFHDKISQAQNIMKAIQFLTGPTKLDFVRIAGFTFPSLVGPV